MRLRPKTAAGFTLLEIILAVGDRRGFYGRGGGVSFYHGGRS